MKKVVLLLFLSLFLLGCAPSAEQILKEIEQANYCTIDSDCMDAGEVCPFSCNVYVNREKVSKISNLLDSVDVACKYGCMECPGVMCEEGRCVPLCNTPAVGG